MFVYIPSDYSDRQTYDNAISEVDLVSDFRARVKVKPQCFSTNNPHPLIFTIEIPKRYYNVKWYANHTKQIYYGHTVIIPNVGPVYNEDVVLVECFVESLLHNKTYRVPLQIPVINGTNATIDILEVNLYPYNSNVLFAGRKYILEILAFSRADRGGAAFTYNVTINNPVVVPVQTNNIPSQYVINVPDDPSLYGKDVEITVEVTDGVESNIKKLKVQILPPLEARRIPYADIYIDPVNGDDTLGDGTLDRPFQTAAPVNNVLQQFWFGGWARENLTQVYPTIGIIHEYPYGSTNPIDVTNFTTTVGGQIAFGFYYPAFFDGNGAPFLFQNRNYGYVTLALMSIYFNTALSTYRNQFDYYYLLTNIKNITMWLEGVTCNIPSAAVIYFYPYGGVINIRDIAVGIDPTSNTYITDTGSPMPVQSTYNKTVFYDGTIHLYNFIPNVTKKPSALGYTGGGFGIVKPGARIYTTYTKREYYYYNKMELDSVVGPQIITPYRKDEPLTQVEFFVKHAG